MHAFKTFFNESVNGNTNEHLRTYSLLMSFDFCLQEDANVSISIISKINRTASNHSYRDHL